MLDNVVKSFVEAASHLKVISSLMLPYNNLKEELHLSPRSHYQARSRIDISHDLASKMTYESDRFRSKVKRSFLWNLVTKSKPYLNPAAPFVTELDSSHFISLRMPLSFPS